MRAEDIKRFCWGAWNEEIPSGFKSKKREFFNFYIYLLLIFLYCSVMIFKNWLVFIINYIYSYDDGDEYDDDDAYDGDGQTEDEDDNHNAYDDDDFDGSDDCDDCDEVA